MPALPSTVIQPHTHPLLAKFPRRLDSLAEPSFQVLPRCSFALLRDTVESLGAVSNFECPQSSIRDQIDVCGFATGAWQAHFDPLDHFGWDRSAVRSRS